ncbi:GDSL-type esterase/lipase family protein [Streptomyces sp. TS71-3]|uniref:GDSL-type esterase/lipase family protein n=1 Tax=Streptomyces sp. TS71-3 TaxID=2733862 RepID=UPI001B27F458|nr:GDSL-type esterase/lipase family protein [Streptomyces sp. TS71-3]GHJ39308.1 lipase [Streptomyces sp. TS71-3]
MYEIPLEDGPVRFAGALDLERRPGGGLLPRRLPAWTRQQYPDAFMDYVAAMPSGVRLAFRTAARTLEVDLLTTVRHFDKAARPAPAGVLDLLVDGRLAAQQPAPTGRVLRLAHARAEGREVPGEPGTVRFTELPEGMKEVELWLPQQTPCELLALRADAALCPPVPSGRRRWVHHGSSISHCTQADHPTGTWPAVAASLVALDVVNLGLAGNCMLDPYVARTIRDLPADLISLELGGNPVLKGTFKLRTFTPAVHGFLDTVREGHPDTPLLVVSPIICPRVEDTVPGAAPTPPPENGAEEPGDPGEIGLGPLTMPLVRDALKSIVRQRRRDDPHLHYLDGRALFGPADAADMPDGVHPSAKGYLTIAERFAERVTGAEGAFGG